MTGYLIRRLFLAVVAMLGVTFIVFICSRLSGDVVYLMLGDGATEAEIQVLRTNLGLDLPMWQQFLVFVGNMLQGDFGDSYRYQRAVTSLIAQRLPATIELAVVTFAIAMVFGVVLGVLSALWRGSWIDGVLRAFAALGQSMPNFWLGLMGIIVFAVMLGWLPTSGRHGWNSLILPSVTLATLPMASILRVTRSSVLETLDSDYVRFLRAKGTRPSTIIVKHVLRNAAIPITALAGLQLGNLLSGAVVVETVFAWPGLGSLLVGSVIARDYSVIQAGALLVSLIIVSLNLFVDLLFGVIDPRVRYG